ncbi:MAG: thioredoxin domain-containing protein [Candidatus Gracilibacteria bacterium]
MIKLGGGFGSAGLPLVDKLSDTDWTKGDKNSKIVMIEYSDFECPACAVYAKIIDEAMVEFGTHIVFAYRHYPLLSMHKNAMSAAYAAEAAGAQGKFWEMHDRLFTYQNSWIQQEAPEETYNKFAKDLGLDIEKFKTDYQSSAIHKNVELDLESAEKNKINSTPTIFINGQQIRNPGNYEGFRTIIRDAIKSNS